MHSGCLYITSNSKQSVCCHNHRLSHVTPRLATGLRNTATDGGGELQDHSQSALSHAQTLQDSAAVSVKRGASFTEGVARHSEELRDMQVLRITANGRLFRCDTAWGRGAELTTAPPPLAHRRCAAHWWKCSSRRMHARLPTLPCRPIHLRAH